MSAVGSTPLGFMRGWANGERRECDEVDRLVAARTETATFEDLVEMARLTADELGFTSTA